MSELLDFTKLESLCWRALCRHHVSERELVISATIIRLSFVIEEPCLRLDRASELSDLTNISRGNVHDVVQRLTTSRALEVSEDRRVYTFLPPSKQWPWLFKERMNQQLADERERGIVWAAKGPKQADFYFHLPEAGQEFAEALAIERMRASLIDYHQAAVALIVGGIYFSATDRSPTAPVHHELSSGEGHSRPLKTTGRGDQISPVASLSAARLAREQTTPPAEEVVPDSGTPFPNLEPIVPESGTIPLREEIKSFKGLELYRALKTPEALKAPFPNREQYGGLAPLDPGASEDEMIAWLKGALGALCLTCHEARLKQCRCKAPDLVPVMQVWGGWWRNAIRGSRYAALNACMNLALRLGDRHLKPLRNRGGWARDEYYKIRGEEAEAKA